MVVFMFMIGAQLVSIFLKGMLGLPFGIMPPDATVNYPVFFLALATLILDNVVLMPHIGSATHETRYAMAACAADNVLRALKGNISQNCVNPQALQQ